jgi:hypothetical protein
MPERNRFKLTPKNLDLKYPGSTFTQVLKSHDKDGRYLVLVVGPFANHLSDDFMILWDFLGRARALKPIYRGLEYQPDACPGNEPAYVGVSCWSLGFFGLG